MDANSGFYLPTPRPRRGTAVLPVLAVLLSCLLMAAGFAVATRATLAHFAGAPTSAAGSTDTLAAVTRAVVDINTTIAGAGGTGSAAGTGMIVSSDGLILSNNHVVKGATAIEVTFQGRGGSYTATVVGVDPADDVALIRVRGVSGLPIVTLADSSTLQVGQAVVAIGNALGRGGAPSVTTGQITALDQSITASDGSSSSEQLYGLIQMDAAISPGDSGGALVNSAGQVVGMITAGQSTGRRQTSTTVGFAIPSRTAAAVARQIESGRGGANIYLGQTGYLGVAVGEGARVEAVAAGSPAAGAGITAGSVITDIGGLTVTGPSDLGPAIWSHAAGEKVQVTWTDSSGARHSATVTLIAGPAA